MATPVSADSGTVISRGWTFTITTVTEKVAQFVRDLFDYIFSLPFKFKKAIQNGVKVLVPAFNKGPLPAYMLGSQGAQFWSFLYRKYVVDSLYDKLTNLACEMLGKGTWETQLARAGMISMYSGDKAHLLFMASGTIAGGIALVVIQGIVFKLIRGIAAHDEVLADVEKAAKEADEQDMADEWVNVPDGQPNFSGDPGRSPNSSEQM